MAWSEEQRRNAAVIYKVGQQVGASLRDIQIAIMAAIVESGLRNLNYGDRDSIGMFQQRNAWGSHADRLDPYKSARMFFQGGAAGQRGLLNFANRDQMGMGQAAQAVQVSAFPDRYAQHTSAAAQLLKTVAPAAGQIEGTPSSEGTLGVVPGLDSLVSTGLDVLEIPEAPSVTEVNGVNEITADDVGIGELKFETPRPNPLGSQAFGQTMAQPTVDPMAGTKLPTVEELTAQAPIAGGGNDSAASGWRGGIVEAARKMLGTPYVWGDASYSGVDCSGLVQLLYGKIGIKLPRVSADQARAGRRVALSDLRPGDLVAWDNSSRNNGADHIAIYIGNGQIIEAPRPGGVVQVNKIYDTGRAWGVAINR